MKWDKWVGKRGEGYVIVQFVLFGVIFVAPFGTRQWAGWPWPYNVVSQILGLILAAAGLLLAMVGVLSLGGNLTAVPRPKENAHMVAHGAYRLVRHPIYSGIISGAVGWGLVHNSLITLLLALVLLAFFDVKSRREEQWLAERYEEYAAYQKRVRKLIPFIY